MPATKNSILKNSKRHCIDFSIYTQPDGYDAIADLKLIFQANEQKLRMLDEVKKIIGDQGEIIDF